jgi:hypothetical protein
MLTGVRQKNQSNEKPRQGLATPEVAAENRTGRTVKIASVHGQEGSIR